MGQGDNCSNEANNKVVIFIFKCNLGFTPTLRLKEGKSTEEEDLEN